jgi:hypothetical protein
MVQRDVEKQLMNGFTQAAPLGFLKMSFQSAESIFKS